MDEIKRELDSLEEEIVSLKAQMAAMGESDAIDERELSTLERKKNDLVSMWDGIKSQGSAAWEEAKDDFQSSLNEIRSGFRDLKDKYL